MSNLIFQQQGSSPTQAGAGYSQLYAKTDGIVYQQVGTNTEVPIMSGSQVGKVLQVVTVTTDAISFSTTSASNVDITGLVASITPSATSSKILVTAVVNCGGSDNNGVGLGLTRGGSRIGDSTETPGSSIRSVMAGCKLQDGNDISTITLNYLDSPSTASAAQYKVQVSCRSDGGAHTFRLNRSNDHNNQSCLVTASSITLMEIAG